MDQAIVDHILHRLHSNLDPPTPRHVHEYVKELQCIVVSLHQLLTRSSDLYLQCYEINQCNVSNNSSCCCIHKTSCLQHIISPLNIKSIALFGRLIYSSKSNSKPWHGLYLDDGEEILPLVLLETDPKQLNEIVLITEWKLISSGAIQYLEVDKIDRVFSNARSTPSLKDFIGLYPILEAPVHGGPYPLQKAMNSHGARVKKKVRYYFVLGRISAVSPMSTQNDKHFFLEVEAFDGAYRQAVSILVSGPTVEYYPFMVPGCIVVLTDLVKVFAKECNMHMLHTTSSSDINHPNTTMLQLTELECSSIANDVNIANFFSFQCSISTPGHIRVPQYTGTLTRRVCDASFELDDNMIVIFAHFPLPNRCAGMRIGSRVTLFNVHQLGSNLVGFCARSSIRIASFSSVNTPIHYQPTKSRIQDLAFHQLPLDIVAYLLDLSQDVLNRFSGTRRLDFHPPWLLFPKDNNEPSKWKKQSILREIAYSAGIQWHPRPTLGKSFLCHDDSCFSAPPGVKIPGHAISLLEFVNQCANLCISLTNSMKSITIDSADNSLPTHLLLGCITGAIGTNNLCLVDKTAKLPLMIQSDNGVMLPRKMTRLSAMYHVRRYKAVVNKIDHNSIDQSLLSLPGVILCDQNLFYIYLKCTPHDLHPIGVQEEEVHKISSLPNRILLLRMDRIAKRWIVHGIKLPLYQEKIDVSLWTLVHLAIPQEHFPWYLQPQSICDVYNLHEAPHPEVYIPPSCVESSFTTNLAKLREIPDPWSIQHWSELESHPPAKSNKVALYRYEAHSDTKFHVLRGTGVVEILCTETKAITTQEDRMYHLLGMHYDKLQTPRSLHMIQLDNPKNTIFNHPDQYMLPRNLHEENLVSIYGWISSLRIVVGGSLELRRKRDSDTTAPLLLVTVQDTGARDSLVVSLKISKFGWPTALALGNMIHLHRVKSHVRKNTYKLACGQCFATHLQISSPLRSIQPATEEMRFLDLYQYSTIDRRHHRILANVCHLSYAFLKCICRHCNGSLTRDRNGTLRHGEFQLCDKQPDPRVQCILKCVVDDGSAQVELFCDGDVAWDLLQMEPSTKMLFEKRTIEKGGEIAFYATSPTELCHPYDISWRTTILETLSSVDQMWIHVQRFYTKEKDTQSWSILRCGEFSIRTSVQPLVQMAGIAIERVHARSEIRRLMYLIKGQ